VIVVEIKLDNFLFETNDLRYCLDDCQDICTFGACRGDSSLYATQEKPGLARETVKIGHL
jgi:hypothetical protein